MERDRYGNIVGGVRPGSFHGPLTAGFRYSPVDPVAVPYRCAHYLPIMYKGRENMKTVAIGCKACVTVDSWGALVPWGFPGTGRRYSAYDVEFQTRKPDGTPVTNADLSTDILDLMVGAGFIGGTIEQPAANGIYNAPLGFVPWDVANWTGGLGDEPRPRASVWNDQWLNFNDIWETVNVMARSDAFALPFVKKTDIAAISIPDGLKEYRFRITPATEVVATTNPTGTATVPDNLTVTGITLNDPKPSLSDLANDGDYYYSVSSQTLYWWQAAASMTVAYLPYDETRYAQFASTNFPGPTTYIKPDTNGYGWYTNWTEGVDLESTKVGQIMAVVGQPALYPNNMFAGWPRDTSHLIVGQKLELLQSGDRYAQLLPGKLTEGMPLEIAAANGTGEMLVIRPCV